MKTGSALSRVLLVGTLSAALAVTGSGLAPQPATAAPVTVNTAAFKSEVPTIAASSWAGSLVQTPALTTPAAPGSQMTVTGTKVSAPTLQSTALTAADPGAQNTTAIPGPGSGNWGASGQLGAFTWNYPLPSRKAPAGQTPSLSLSYDSSRVDGLTSATNSQASVVGDGWALGGAGYIRQSFTSCKDQGVSSSYDLCGNPTGQSLSISFGGRNTQLVKDSGSGAWKLQSDDNTRIEYVKTPGINGTFDGGYWKLTDNAGTQYFFGRNQLPGWVVGKPTTNSVSRVPVGAAKPDQPCAAATFKDSLCQQAWMWNLDHIVDLNGNTQAFYYDQETNWYASAAGTGNRLDYTRAARLSRIDYGMRTGEELAGTAPLRFSLDYLDRCNGIDCSKGNDVPAQYICPQTGTCTTLSPTFFTSQRLTKITASTRLNTGAYQAADTWALGHTMPDPGDGTKPALWLGQVTHTGNNTATGTGAAITDPPTVFGGQTLQNRVWVTDGLAPLNRYRISTIKTPAGAVTSVAYNAAECSPTNLPASPETNTKRCYPQWWAPMEPIAQAPRMDYFHIYPVARVSTNAGPGAEASTDVETRYEYIGTPAWKYAGAKVATGTGGSQKTWSVAAGWQDIKTVVGAPDQPATNAVTTSTYLRGLNGTPSNTSGGVRTSSITLDGGKVVEDSPINAGRLVQIQSFNGVGGPLLSSTINEPWTSAPTATNTAQGTEARFAGTLSTTTREPSSVTGGWNTSTVTSVFDNYGRTTATSASTDSAKTTDDTCTVTVYADNTSANILTAPATTSTSSGLCTAQGTAAGNIMTATRVFYADSTSATPGTTGYKAPVTAQATRSDDAVSATGQTVTKWQEGPTRTFDALGRVTSSTDRTTGADRKTTVAYSPATGPPTTITTTNPKGWQSTVTADAVRGAITTTTDAAGATTTTDYDASGRPVASWDPLRPKAQNPDPSTSTEYNLSQTAPSWIRNNTRNSSNGNIATFQILDGMGRLRQTQRLSPPGGTIATDVLYNSNGERRLVRNDYYLTESPSGTLRIPAVAVPSSTEYTYDGAGRVTKTRALANDNQELWSTTAAYPTSDTTTITGPAGKPATTVVTDGQGNPTLRKIYQGATPTGASEDTTYTHDAMGQMVALSTAGNTWTWEYDLLGRQTKTIDPDTGTTTATYDVSGRTASTTDGKGVKLDTSYDVLDRPTQTTATTAGVTKTLETRTYDLERKGSLSEATRFNGPNYDQAVKTTQSGFNNAGQPTNTSTVLPAGMGALAGTYTTGLTYKQNGLPDVLSLPGIKTLPAETLYYGYDNFDNPISVDNETWDIFAGNAQYDVLGNLASFDQSEPNSLDPTLESAGLQTNYFKWDATTGRLIKQTTTNWAKNATRTVAETSYAYDPAGKITAKTSPEEVECYTYDYAERLTGVWTPSSKSCTGGFTAASLGGPAPYAQQYAYTPSGERAQVKRYKATGALQSTDDYTYPAAEAAGAHRPTTITTTPAGAAAATHSLTWDGAGQLTGRAGQTLAYTADGKISTTTDKSTLPANPNRAATAGGTTGTGTRYYDASGTLVGINDTTGVTSLLANATVHVNTAGKATGTRDINFAGKTVAQRVTTDTGSKIRFLTPDAVNTTTSITQATPGAPGTATTKRYSDPFGLERSTTATATTATNAANPTGFSATNGYLSELNDAATTLTHLGARDYDPVLGIFTAPDPIYNWGTTGGHSPYTYSNNDPINQSDPSGLCPICVLPWIAIALAGALSGATIVKPTYSAPSFSNPFDDGMHLTERSRYTSQAPSYPPQPTYGPVSASSSAAVSFPRASVGTSSASASGTWSSAYPSNTSYYPPRSSQPGNRYTPTPSSVSQAAAAAAAAAAAEAARRAALAAQAAAQIAQAAAANLRMNNENTGDNQSAAGSAGATGGESGGGSPDPEDDKPAHGNSAASTARAFLYRLSTDSGEYLKTGISKNPLTRYTKKFMDEKVLDIIQSGTRREILNLERFIVERDPGPLNFERWAGKFLDDVP